MQPDASAATTTSCVDYELSAAGLGVSWRIWRGTYRTRERVGQANESQVGKGAREAPLLQLDHRWRLGYASV